MATLGTESFISAGHDMDLDTNVIQELRQLAMAGTPPSQLLATLGRRLGLQDTNFRLLAIAYFREAFDLSLADAKGIGAASIFPGGGRGDAELDNEMAPIIRAAAHR
jgi:hypothetical protein